MKPGALATKAINQYRSRDVVPYLALRYYLESTCARSDRWSSEVAVHLTKSNDSPIYFESQHFKERAENESIIHRSIFLPAPSEALAETTLLAECSKYEVFDPKSCVYSYRLAQATDRTGIFVPYFNGFRQRHRDVANACRLVGEGTVSYTDIKRFYPSIRSDQALGAWSKSLQSTTMPKYLAELGCKLLENHATVCEISNQHRGILTGPMFSHVIANQLLRPVDALMSDSFPGRYFRYVDDVILVGSSAEVKRGRNLLDHLLAELNLELHSEDATKTFSIDTTGWLKGESDFEEVDSRSWMRFVGDLRRFLIAKPAEQASLATSFDSHGFSIPLTDYLNAATEAEPMQRLADQLRRYRWANNSIQKISVSWLLNCALNLRITLEARLSRLLTIDSSISGYERKRLIPKLRYLGGRLLYLSTPETQIRFAEELARFPELHLFSTVLQAVATRNVSRLLPLGSNAVQSAAQVLRLSSSPILFSNVFFNEAALQGLAILQLNGVNIGQEQIFPTNLNSLNNFSSADVSMLPLMRDSNLYIREMACLHGADKTARHSLTLNSAFNRDEQLSFDVLNQLSQSGYN